jgi:hypothetical protein
MDLLWDILREMGLLKKKESEPRKEPATEQRPKRKKKPQPDPFLQKKRAIEEEDPEAVARAIKRMIKRDK